MTLGGRKAAKWAVWTLALLMLTGLQTAPAVASAAGPVLGAAMAVSVLLAEPDGTAGCGFMVLAGLLWDVSAGKYLGYYGLMLLGAGLLIQWLIKNYLRRSAGNAVWLAAAVTFFCRLADAGLSLFIWGYAGESGWAVVGELALQGLWTGCAAGPLCLFARFVRRRAMGEEPSSLRLRRDFNPERPRGRRR